MLHIQVCNDDRRASFCQGFTELKTQQTTTACNNPNTAGQIKFFLYFHLIFSWIFSFKPTAH